MSNCGKYPNEGPIINDATPRMLEMERQNGAEGGQAMSDLINGLRYMADDHPCCEGTILQAMDRLELLERENNALLNALKEVAARGPHDGCCGYGCDSPGIAMAAIDAAMKEVQP